MFEKTTMKRSDLPFFVYFLLCILSQKYIKQFFVHAGMRIKKLRINENSRKIDGSQEHGICKTVFQCGALTDQAYQKRQE